MDPIPKWKAQLLERRRREEEEGRRKEEESLERLAKIPAWQQELMERRRSRPRPKPQQAARLPQAPSSQQANGPALDLGSALSPAPETQDGAVLQENIGPVNCNPFVRQEQRRKQVEQGARLEPRAARVGDNPLQGHKGPPRPRAWHAGVPRLPDIDPSLTRSAEDLSSLGMAEGEAKPGRVSRLLSRFGQRRSPVSRSRSTDTILRCCPRDAPSPARPNERGASSSSSSHGLRAPPGSGAYPGPGWDSSPEPESPPARDCPIPSGSWNPACQPYMEAQGAASWEVPSPGPQGGLGYREGPGLRPGGDPGGHPQVPGPCLVLGGCALTLGPCGESGASLETSLRPCLDLGSQALGPCGGPDPGPCGGPDPGPCGGPDPGPCGGPDPGPCGGPDPGPCGGPDPGLCGGPDPGPCGGPDTGPCGGPDTGPCGGPDPGPCGGPGPGPCGGSDPDPCGGPDPGPCLDPGGQGLGSCRDSGRHPCGGQPQAPGPCLEPRGRACRPVPPAAGRASCSCAERTPVGAGQRQQQEAEAWPRAAMSGPAGGERPQEAGGRWRGLRPGCGPPGRAGRTITITPRRPGPGGRERASGNGPQPSPASRRYPTAEEILVIGGYLSLRRSCLVKDGGSRRKLNISFNDGELESTFEYPSELALLAEFGSDEDETPPQARLPEEDEEEDEEEEVMGTSTIGRSIRGKPLLVDESCR